MTTENTTDEVLTPAAIPEQVAPPTEQTAVPDGESKQVEEKTFTQAELDAILQARLAKQERQSLKRERELLDSFKPQAAPQPIEDEAPRRDQFPDDEKWVKASIKWGIDQDRAQERMVREADQKRELGRKTEKLYTEAAKLPGFDREAFDELITPVIAHAITDSDIAPRLMAHLSANPDYVDKITKLSPARQAAEIGRLEEKLSVVKEVQVAPPPIAKVKGDGPVYNGDLSKLPMDEYIKARTKMGARWAR